MKTCPQCRKVYSDLVKVCPDCKVPLGSEAPAQQTSQNQYAQQSQNVRPQNQYVQQSNQHASSVQAALDSIDSFGQSGSSVAASRQQASQTHANQTAAPAAAGKVGFSRAVALYFTHFFDFKTRSSRSEFWWVFLFNLLLPFAVGIAASLLAAITGSMAVASIMGKITGIWMLISGIPTLALTVRRLHDVGKSGWWLLMGLIPLVGGIIVLVQVCRRSDGSNQWGTTYNV